MAKFNNDQPDTSIQATNLFQIHFSIFQKQKMQDCWEKTLIKLVQNLLSSVYQNTVFIQV